MFKTSRGTSHDMMHVFHLSTEVTWPVTIPVHVLCTCIWLVVMFFFWSNLNVKALPLWYGEIILFFSGTCTCSRMIMLPHAFLWIMESWTFFCLWTWYCNFICNHSCIYALVEPNCDIDVKTQQVSVLTCWGHSFLIYLSCTHCIMLYDFSW